MVKKMKLKLWKEYRQLSVQEKKRIGFYMVCAVLFYLSLLVLVGYSIYCWWQNKSTETTQKVLQNIRETAENVSEDGPVSDDGATAATKEQSAKPEILPKYQSLYEINSDMVGWLSIDDTVVDYPVMQTMDNETYYIDVDFYKKSNKNGCLIMDTDSTVGTGTAARNYEDGTAPSTNLIIHGHTVKKGEMFGDLPFYAEREYGKEHNIICFDSLYEERKYEVISVFYSQVYYEEDDVFKFYKFFQADTQEEFDNWYDNIKEMSLYDTGVTAEFGDEFITLSSCTYQVEDGRFVVVGKRIK